MSFDSHLLLLQFMINFSYLKVFSKARHDDALPISSALERQREVDLFEFKGSLIHVASSRPAKAK